MGLFKSRRGVYMIQTLNILNKVIPKEMEVLHRRYALLKAIQVMQPVGRRVLSAKLIVGEKIVRHDTDYLREEGYLIVTMGGMILTEEGILLLEDLKNVMKEFEGIKDIEARLTTVLGCNDITVVLGDTDLEPNALNNIGKAAADLLQNLLNEDSIVAITGGHTIKSMVRHIKTTPDLESNRMIVPARGSLGNDIETQANTLVELMAKKMNCQYRLLNLPDNLSEKAIESVYKDPAIKKIIKDIKKANIIVFGIGNAKKMAYRRDLNKKILKVLDDKKAVAEALGYYFNQEGKMVYDSKTIGFHLEEFEKDIHPIAVAGGASKAQAILAVRQFIKNGSLIIDEACAIKVLELSEEIEYNRRNK